MSVKKQQLKRKSVTAGHQDTHICGNCASIFLTIKAFLAHKKKGCVNQLLTSSQESSVDNKTEDVVDSAETSNETKTDSDTLKKHRCSYEGCSYSTKYAKDLERHTRIHTGEKPHRCDKCEKCFSRLDKLKLHRRYHTGVKPYKCNQCEYAAADGSSLKKHLLIHSGERPFKCQLCSYASRNSSQLVVHLRTHTGDTPFHCPHCSSKFKINSDLKRHLRLHTGEKPYQCTFCDYKCAVKSNLTTHHRLNHSTGKSFPCENCEFTTPSKKLLIQHEKSHSRAPFRCRHNNCLYKCDSDISLKAHLITHTKEKVFKCVQCEYTSRLPGSVRSHTKKHHGDESVEAELPGRLKVCSLMGKKFKCSLCPSSFAREDSLRSHMRHHPRHESTEPVEPCPAETTTTGVLVSEHSTTSSSVYSFYPAEVETISGDVPQQQILYQFQPGINVLALPSDTIQYVFQTANNCILLENDPRLGGESVLLASDNTIDDQLIETSIVL